MHGEEGIHRDEHGTGFEEFMEEDKWKEEAGIYENDEGEDRMGDTEDERLNIVDIQQRNRKEEGHGQTRKEVTWAKLFFFWRGTGRICNTAAGAWVRPQRTWGAISGKEFWIL